MKSLALAWLGLLAFAVGNARGEVNDYPKAPAPVGVHLVTAVPEHELTLAYRYERDRYKGLREERMPISAQRAIAERGFAEAPSRWVDVRHDFDLRWTPGNRFALAVGLPVYRREMTLRQAGGGRRRIAITAPGDLRVDGIVRFMRRGEQTIHLSVGFAAPTGEIGVRDDGQLLPYVLRPGAGVWTFRSGVAYRGGGPRLSWGGQVDLQVRTEDNARDYHRGNEYAASGWLAGQLFEDCSASVRLHWSHWEDLRGEDAALNPSANPLNDANIQSGHRVELGAGVNFRVPAAGEPLLAIEALLPVREVTDGLQASRDWSLRAGWSWAF